MVGPQEHDQAAGLLEQIAETSLDDDYYGERSGPARSREFNTVLTALVLAVFALLVTTAALQTRSDRPATELERRTLVDDVEARKDLLSSRQARADELRTEIAALSTSVERFDPALENLRVQTAVSGASGPGVTVTANPSERGNLDGRILDTDLQLLVNGLWYAGAEAVSVNGKRIGSLSSIRTAAGAITVNYVSIGPPYRIVALGDMDALDERFRDNPAGRFWESRKKNAGVQFDVSRSSNLAVEAAPARRVAISHATAIEGKR